MTALQPEVAPRSFHLPSPCMRVYEPSRATRPDADLHVPAAGFVTRPPPSGYSRRDGLAYSRFGGASVAARSTRWHGPAVPAPGAARTRAWNPVCISVSVRLVRAAVSTMALGSPLSACEPIAIPRLRVAAEGSLRRQISLAASRVLAARWWRAS